MSTGAHLVNTLERHVVNTLERHSHFVSVDSHATYGLNCPIVTSHEPGVDDVTTPCCLMKVAGETLSIKEKQKNLKKQLKL